MDQTGEAVAAHWSIGSECEESPTHECIKTNSFDERTSIHVRDNEGDDNQSMTQANLPENQEMYNTCNEQQLKAESFLKEEFGASEHILDYYSCALQRGILLQGWMYITYSSMCFYANIMGAITKEAFSFSDVTNITKVTQALVNPGIQFTLRDSSEVEIFSFIDRDIAFELCVHVWDFKRMNMLSPTEVLNGQQGPCLGAVLPTFQLVLQRWRQFAVADAFRSWCLRAMAHCMTARTQQQAFCSWWRQVLTVAGMDEAKMRACVLQRWRMIDLSCIISVWRRNAVYQQLYDMLQTEMALDAHFKLQRVLVVLQRGYRSQSPRIEPVLRSTAGIPWL